MNPYSVIVVFRGRNGKFAAAKFVPFRNLLQLLILFMKNLSFHNFKTEQSSESQHRPFLLLSHNSFKAPSHFSTEIRMYLRVAAPVQFYPIATSDLMSYHLFTSIYK